MNRKNARSLLRTQIDALTKLSLRDPLATLPSLDDIFARPEPRSVGQGFHVVKEFVLDVDRSSRVVTAVSMRDSGSRATYRVATHREILGQGGTFRRSAWLGLRELMLKNQLEKKAMDFIAVEVAKKRAGDALVIES